MNIMKDRFHQFSCMDSFQRVDENHILDLYVGIDNMSRFTLFLISEQPAKQIYSSQTIEVQVGLRRDNKWGISFSLANDKFEDLFCHFCSDIVESSRELTNKKDGSEFISNRYEKWQNMLAKANSGLLSSSSVKGLIGELYFLKNYLIPLYGEGVAINSWIGPEMADQDFVCNGLWYEVKATVSGAESVHITSIEQLDNSLKGELVIIYLDKTSHTDEQRITLNSIYKAVSDSLTTDHLRQKLSEILLCLGFYPRIEYDEITFRFKKIERYNVTPEFPCIRKTMLPFSIINAKYELSIASINSHIKE